MSVDAELIWDQLRASTLGDGVLEIPSVPTKVQWESRAVRFALGPEGMPCILVPIDGSTPPPVIQETRNLSVNVFRAKAAGVVGVYLNVMCLDRRLVTVFGSFCQSVIDSIASGDDPAMAVKLAIDAFRELFSAPIGRELSDAERLGLIGELWMLERLTADNPALIEAWTGPHGQRHDFRRCNTSIEIKTSSRKGNSLVSISSIEQLSRPDSGELYLWHLVFEAAMEGGSSISSLLEKIILNGVARTLLHDALSGLKLDLDLLIAVERSTFALEGVSAFHVKPGFPCVSLENFNGHLPNGVISLSYELDLRAASQWKLQEPALDSLLKDFSK